MTNMRLGIYKHHKGKEYGVIGVAKHSETLQDLVIYECLYDNDTSKIWVRPLYMFEEEIYVNGNRTPRFKYLRES